MGWHRTESAWRWLEDDPDLRSGFLTKIRELEEARVKESEERLEEEKQSRMEVQKAAWLAKKKEISGRWKVNEVKKDRDMGEMVEVDDLKEDTQHDNVKEHTFLDDILAGIGDSCKHGHRGVCEEGCCQD